MPSKRTEFGRSLVETLAVLVVIAILLLAGLAGYNFAIHKYKKDQTVKAISELAVRYKLHPISTTGAVNIKAVYPEAERADAVNMRTADTDTGRVQLEVSEDNSYFAVVVNNILDDSCAEYLEKGEYDAALLLKGEKYDSKSDKEYLALGKDFLKDFDLNKLTTEQKGKLGALTNGKTSKEDVIKVICAGAPQAKTAAFVFGDKCPKRGASHYYNGKCWPCPQSQKEDRYGVCCDGYNECGVCGCPTETPQCDTASGQCVECINDDHCPDKENKGRCDTTTHKCVKCVEDSDCENDPNGCPTHCNLKTHTCSDGCDTAKSWWKLSDGVCVCEKTLQEGEECSTTCGPNCCATGLTCHADSQRCCPTNLPGYNELCVAGCGCTKDLICGTNNKCECGEGLVWDSTQEKCVGCLTDTDCEGITQCNVEEKLCCPSDKPYYSTSLKMCVACLADYGSGLTGACTTTANPVCDNTGASATWTCGPCPSGQTWDNTKGECVCPSEKPYYSTTLKMCVECLVDYGKGNGACTTTDKPLCKSDPETNPTNQKCFPCPDGQRWDNTKGECVAVVCVNGTEGECATCVNNTWVKKEGLTIPRCMSCDLTTGNWKGHDGIYPTEANDPDGLGCGQCNNPAKIGEGKVILRNPNPCPSRTDGRTYCEEKDSNGNDKWLCGCPDGQTWDVAKGKCTVPMCQKSITGTVGPGGWISKIVPNVEEAGKIGPYDCDYKVIITNGGVDDYFCVQGAEACSESEQLAHKISGTNAIYILPKGKTLTFYEVNTKDKSGKDQYNASLHLHYTLEPITEGSVKEGCTGTLLHKVNDCQNRSLECPSGSVKMWEHSGGTISNKGRNGEEYCCKDTIIQHNVCRESHPLFSGYLADKETANKYGGTSQSKFECCPKDRIQEYKHSDFPGQVLKQCCPEGYHGNSEINAECCPKNKTWNSWAKQCEDALECTTTGTRLYYRKASSSNGQGNKQGDCCEPDQKLVTENLANALFAGYKAGENTKYGCCPIERVNGNGCCKTTEKAVANGCCAKNKVYTENGVQKCCNGTVYNDGKSCSNVILTCGSCYTTGRTYTTKHCSFSLTIPEEEGTGSWRVNGSPSAWVESTSKCSIGLSNGSVVSVGSNGRISVENRLSGTGNGRRISVSVPTPTLVPGGSCTTGYSISGRTITFEAAVEVGGIHAERMSGGGSCTGTLLTKVD